MGGNLQVNDEECLLGTETKDVTSATLRGDGVDSPSGSEDDNTPPAPLPPPVQETPEIIQVPSSVGATLIPAPATSPPQATQNKYEEVDLQVTSRLDRFFKDDSMWLRISQEIDLNGVTMLATRADILAGGKQRRTFRVQVPKPYPGVQYRKTKCMDDKAARYAKHGELVSGDIEDGEWLRVNHDRFLP